MAKKERVRRKKGGKEKTAKVVLLYFYNTHFADFGAFVRKKKINICLNEEVYLKRKQKVFEQARILLAQQALTLRKMSEGLFVVWTKMKKLSIFIYLFIYLFCSVPTSKPAKPRFTGEIRGEQSYYNCKGKLFNPFMTAGKERKRRIFHQFLFFGPVFG